MVDRDAGQVAPSRCFAVCEREYFRQRIAELEHQREVWKERAISERDKNKDLEQQLSTLQQGIDHIAGLEPRIHHVVDAIRIARNTNRKLKEQDNG